MVRLIAAVLSMIVLFGGVFVALSYFENNQLLLQNDPKASVDVANQLLLYFITTSVIAVLCIALLIYVVLTRKVFARKLAYKLSQDALRLSKNSIYHFRFANGALS